ncbi:hypothetical protein D6856_10265 [Butyrivibrio sp. XB500-5]|nr:hypothetical protein D6856_10265 [Butyrivibrio sp. XB500-5]
MLKIVIPNISNTEKLFSFITVICTPFTGQTVKGVFLFVNKLIRKFFYPLKISMEAADNQCEKLIWYTLVHGCALFFQTKDGLHTEVELCVSPTR